MKSVIAAIVIAVTSTASSWAITIDTVPVGNVGNPNDPGTGNLYGGVNYAYSIGKYEVTVGQYTAFLNAVAATDTYSLYNTAMATDLNIAGIAQSGASGSYVYSVIGSPNHPITYVSWGDAARFANWLHNGQPTGAQNASTTEDGAYTLNGATTSSALIAVTRNAGATWFIPTQNEWFKAAYYQPTAQGGDSNSYWDYPTKTNYAPYSDQPPGVTRGNTAAGNFYQDDGVANGYNDGYAVTGSTSYSTGQNYLTDVGAYSFAPSFYGTLDQGGNVFEWNETVIGGGRPGSGSRGDLGGSWRFTSNQTLTSAVGNNAGPTNENSDIGFRVASIPEPATLFLAIAASAKLLLPRRRWTSHNRV